MIDNSGLPIVRIVHPTIEIPVLKYLPSQFSNFIVDSENNLWTSLPCEGDNKVPNIRLHVMLTFSRLPIFFKSRVISVARRLVYELLHAITVLLANGEVYCYLISKLHTNNVPII